MKRNTKNTIENSVFKNYCKSYYSTNKCTWLDKII